MATVDSLELTLPHPPASVEFAIRYLAGKPAQASVDGIVVRGQTKLAPRVRQVDAAVGFDSSVMSTYPSRSIEIREEGVMLARSLSWRTEDTLLDLREIAQPHQPDDFVESELIEGF